MFLSCIVSEIFKISKTGQVTDHAPFRVACHRRLGFDTVYLYAKFDYGSFSRQPFQKYN